MLKKRLIAGMAACLMAVSAFSVSASANSALENMKATIYGGATVSSASAEKTAVGKFFITARANTSDGWNTSGNEWVYFRGRSAKNNAQATKLVHRNYYGEQVRDYMGYLSGYGTLGTNYRIAIEYDNSNPYEYVNLRMTWTP